MTPTERAPDGGADLEAMGSVEMARRLRALEEWAFGGTEEEGRWEYPDGTPIPTCPDGTMVGPTVTYEPGGPVLVGSNLVQVGGPEPEERGYPSKKRQDGGSVPTEPTNGEPTTEGRAVARAVPVAAPPGGEPSEAAVEVVRDWFCRWDADGDEWTDEEIRDLLARLAALPVAAMPPAAAREVVWAYARVVERLDSDETADGSAAYRALEAEVDRLEAEIIAAMVRPVAALPVEPSEPDERIGAWHAVWGACVKAGMDTDAEPTGLGCVLAFVRRLAALPVEGEPHDWPTDADRLCPACGPHADTTEDGCCFDCGCATVSVGDARTWICRPQPAGAPELVTIKLDDTHTRDVTVADLAERYERQRVTLVEMNAEEARRDALAKGAPDGLRDWIVTAQRRAYGQEYRSALADVLAQLDRAAPGQHGPPAAPSEEHGTVSVPGGLRELREYAKKAHDRAVRVQARGSVFAQGKVWALGKMLVEIEKIDRLLGAD